MTCEPSEVRHLSLTTLVSEIAGTATQLLQRQIDLATAEVRTDLRAELATVKLVGAGVVAGTLGIELVAVAAVIAVATWIGVSVVAALLVTGLVVLAVAGGLGAFAWRRHVERPLEATRRTVRKDVEWAKAQTA